MVSPPILRPVIAPAIISPGLRWLLLEYDEYTGNETEIGKRCYLTAKEASYR